ncbi:MAG: multiheme c-type cytochrome [Bacteroidota bacterium]
MKPTWAVLVGVSLLTLALLGGCGGHDGQVPVGPGPGPAGATFVGLAVCATCHSGPANAYVSGSPHGKNFHDPASNSAHADLINGFGGSCAPCHVTGFGEPSGWKSSAETPQLDNIGCEECHGAGSTHAGAPSGSNINLIPDAQTTCWDCHVPTYKLLRSGPPPPTTDATLAATAPGKVSPHYRQTPFLLGYSGFDRDQVQGPHAQIDNTCVTCHLNPEDSSRKHGATGLDVDYSACAACHGSAQAAQALFESFDEEINAELVQIGGANPSDPTEPDESASGGMLAAFATAHNIDLNTNANPNDPFVKAYKAARYNYIFIIGGKATHNPPFAEKLIDDTKKLLQ